MKFLFAFFLFCFINYSYAQNLSFPIGIGTSVPYSYFSNDILHLEGTRPTIRLSPLQQNGLATILLKGAYTANNTSSPDEFHINYTSSFSNPSITIGAYFNVPKTVLSLKGEGKVGIGTESPQTAFQIGEFHAGDERNQVLIPGLYNFEQLRLGQIGNGNQALEFVNHSNLNDSYGIKLTANVDQRPGFQIQYAPSSNTYTSLNYQTGFYMGLTGLIGIGTTTPDEKLTVKGKIHAEEVRVDLSVPGPDYVFEQDYQLKSLPEIQAFIKENKHLPEIPSAKEMKKNGVNLSKMNMLLLKKVEELTLHLIKQNEEIKELKDEIKTIKTKL